jgi:hypothetical protein
MDEKEQKFARDWEAKRARGKARFVLMSGVVGWGIPMFFFMTFIVNRKRAEDPRLVLLSAIIWALGGAGFGFFIWVASEKKYQKLQEKSDRLSSTDH